ncbi:hypothetical protein F5Y16DRAFT_373944 [Xylariaceae sp. FL0255]|nr:hypothetical protein F5Y16DRAFT_373944 [Xylariaceae sp. FL0255]
MWWGKRQKPRYEPDYRERWPTQMTLVESCDSSEHDQQTWRSKISEFLQSLFRSKPSRKPAKPGKSTHPYDTEFSHPPGTGAEGSGHPSTPKPQWWKFLSRTSRPASYLSTPTASHAPIVPESSRAVPATPVDRADETKHSSATWNSRYLRRWLNLRGLSPFPRSLDHDWGTERETRRSNNLTIPKARQTSSSAPATPLVVLASPAAQDRETASADDPRPSLDLRNWLNRHRFSPFPRYSKFDGPATENTSRCLNTPITPDPPKVAPAPTATEAHPNRRTRLRTFRARLSDMFRRHKSSEGRRG